MEIYYFNCSDKENICYLYMNVFKRCKKKSLKAWLIRLVGVNIEKLKPLYGIKEGGKE